MSNTGYCPNYMLNSEITLKEVQRVVYKAKLNKTVSVENLSNEDREYFTLSMSNVLSEWYYSV